VFTMPSVPYPQSTATPVSSLSHSQKLLADVATEFDIAHQVAQAVTAMPVAEPPTAARSGRPGLPSAAGAPDITNLSMDALGQASANILGQAAQRVAQEQWHYQQALAAHWAAQEPAPAVASRTPTAAPAGDIVDVSARTVP
jgi:hypothetical protein